MQPCLNLRETSFLLVDTDLAEITISGEQYCYKSAKQHEHSDINKE